MRIHRPKTAFFIFFALTIIFVIGLATWSLGYRVNLSASYPLGIWKLIKPFDPATDRGKLVLVCPPDMPIFKLAKHRGYLRYGFFDSGIQPLLKRVVGLEWDWIEVSEDGIQVNGNRILNSRQLAKDSKGRLLPRVNDTLLWANEAWVMSEYSPDSFDSRYFGPVPYDNIIGVVEPVWLWK